MSKMIFVSLPVTDLKVSMAFYESIGFQERSSVHRRNGRVHGVE